MLGEERRVELRMVLVSLPRAERFASTSLPCTLYCKITHLFVVFYCAFTSTFVGFYNPNFRVKCLRPMIFVFVLTQGCTTKNQNGNTLLKSSKWKTTQCGGNSGCTSTEKAFYLVLLSTWLLGFSVPLLPVSTCFFSLPLLSLLSGS